MQATIKDGKLIIEIDLQTPPVPSASGKTLVVASHPRQPGDQPCNRWPTRSHWRECVHQEGEDV